MVSVTDNYIHTDYVTDINDIINHKLDKGTLKNECIRLIENFQTNREDAKNHFEDWTNRLLDQKTIKTTRNLLLRQNKKWHQEHKLSGDNSLRSAITKLNLARRIWRTFLVPSSRKNRRKIMFQCGWFSFLLY